MLGPHITAFIPLPLPLQTKSRLGAIVHKKTATALALTAVKNEVGGMHGPPACVLLGVGAAVL